MSAKSKLQNAFYTLLFSLTHITVIESGRKHDLLNALRTEAYDPMRILYTTPNPSEKVTVIPCDPIVRFHPAPLEGYWWKAVHRKNDPNRTCTQPPDCVKAVGKYGRTNNMLVEFANLVIYQAQFHPQGINMTIVLNSDMKSFLQYFNHLEVLSALGCFEIDDSKECEHEIPMNYVFTLQFEKSNVIVDEMVASIMRGRILAQLFLRPTQELQNSVEEFDKQYNLSCTGYTAIHLRWMEGQCMQRNSNMRQTLRDPFMLRKGFNASDLCHMSDRYIDFHTRDAPKHSQFVIIHDRQKMDRVEEIQKKYNAIIYTGPSELVVDMLLALRSTIFIGNPASTLSQNVVAMRSFGFDFSPLPSNLVLHNNPSY
eukprot:m.342170 g.342170  ORF g.342170 m.342170 type:complete len:369 (-) comp21043_c0_seq1:5-1111(-)